MAECFLSLELTSRLEFLPDLDVDYFAQSCHVKILAKDMEESIEFEVGYAKLIQVRVGAAINADYPLTVLFDASQAVADCCFPVMDCEARVWSQAVHEVWGQDVFDPDILIFDRLEILPEFRGQDIGLFSMARLIEMLSSGCGLVVIKPFPLQFVGSESQYKMKGETLGLDQFKTSLAEATEKLILHYGRLGFRSLPKTDLYCLATACCSVSPETLGYPQSGWFDLPLPE